MMVALQEAGAQWKYFLLAGLFIGLSFLSKGPVSLYALLLPFLISYMDYIWYVRAREKMGVSRFHRLLRKEPCPPYPTVFSRHRFPYFLSRSKNSCFLLVPFEASITGTCELHFQAKSYPPAGNSRISLLRLGCQKCDINVKNCSFLFC